MGKKMKLPFLYRTTSDPNPSPSPWPFPSCGNIKTHSFRGTRNEFYRTVNPSYVDSTTTATDTPDSVITSTSTPPSGSVSSMTEDSSSGDNQIENVIRGLKSERLFFEPGESNSILESGAKTSSRSKSRSRASADGGVDNHAAPYKESVVLSMESKDPFVDFRKSMEEMVEAHGLIKNWEGLEELLGWYLRVNGKFNHSYIIGAFVDLLVSFSFDNFVTTATTSSSSSSSSLATSTSTCSQSPLSPLSFPSSSLTTTPRLSSLGQGDDEDYDHNDHVLSSS